MKTKIIIFLAVSAVLTLSFTFASVKISPEVKKTETNQTQNEPVGGFVSEDKF